MNLSTLLIVLVVIFAVIVLLGRIALDPWLGILALGVALIIGSYIGPRRV